MSVTYVGAELRRLVLARSNGLCEYCLIAAEDTFLGFEVDHIVGEKHGGSTDAANLACSCVPCNKSKGSDIGSIHWESGEYVRFFHPRQDTWFDHFQLIEDRIESLTPIGAVTVRILGFNTHRKREERRLLISIGRYPSVEASRRMHLQ